MLSLNKICDVSFSINTTDNKSTSWSANILFGDKSKVKLLLWILSTKSLDKDIAKDARDFEWGELPIFEISQHIVVEDEMRNISYTVRVLHCKISEDTVLSLSSGGVYSLR